MKWIMLNWKKAALAGAGLIGGVLGVLAMIPGDQGESYLQKILDLISGLV